MTTSPSERIVCDLGGKTECRFATRLAAAESALAKARRERDERDSVLWDVFDDGATAPVANARSALHTGDYHGWIDDETAAFLCWAIDRLATLAEEDYRRMARAAGESTDGG